MRRPLYDPDAPKQAVTVRLNSDLYARAQKSGIDLARVAEQALAEACSRERTARIAIEVETDLAAIAAYEERCGAFGEHARAAFRASRR